MPEFTAFPVREREIIGLAIMVGWTDDDCFDCIALSTFLPTSSRYLRDFILLTKPHNKMDSSQVDISKLSETDKKELNQFLANEAQKTTLQQSE